MGSKNLTLNMKAKNTPILLERDFPGKHTPHCFYCGQEFIENDPKYRREWEHLNNNPEDNRPENLVWAHAKCNQLKKHKPDWQILARQKLEENVRYHFESLGVGEGDNIAHTQTQPNDQIDANADASKIAEEYLTERLLPQLGRPPLEEKIDFSDAADTVAFKCYKQHGHGSQNTITRILKMLTCSDSKFERYKDGGRTYIRKRIGK